MTFVGLERIRTSTLCSLRRTRPRSGTTLMTDDDLNISPKDPSNLASTSDVLHAKVCFVASRQPWGVIPPPLSDSSQSESLLSFIYKLVSPTIICWSNFSLQFPLSFQVKHMLYNIDCQIYALFVSFNSLSTHSTVQLMVPSPHAC